MPEAAIASACCRISCSLTLQANLFQEFQPIGGVGARFGLGVSSLRVSWAWAGVATTAASAAVAASACRARRRKGGMNKVLSWNQAARAGAARGKGMRRGQRP